MEVDLPFVCAILFFVLANAFTFLFGRGTHVSPQRLLDADEQRFNMLQEQVKVLQQKIADLESTKEGSGSTGANLNALASRVESLESQLAKASKDNEGKTKELDQLKQKILILEGRQAEASLVMEMSGEAEEQQIESEVNNLQEQVTLLQEESIALLAAQVCHISEGLVKLQRFSCHEFEATSLLLAEMNERMIQSILDGHHDHLEELSSSCADHGADRIQQAELNESLDVLLQTNEGHARLAGRCCRHPLRAMEIVSIFYSSMKKAVAQKVDALHAEHEEVAQPIKARMHAEHEAHPPVDGQPSEAYLEATDDDYHELTGETRKFAHGLVKARTDLQAELRPFDQVRVLVRGLMQGSQPTQTS
ncbi:hypothetical protein IE81DRAFT_364639 [Ceraceosorus guamensis]|uniref:Uncharacterized protein n=1 Tax=Ceraceosorus guamensis TaxID=1522189 RepID=A0A316W4H0_9BASI|nr:hypothetical protein IE81DRAFT_364639 [Ceraceosorus guamensis]PWN44639.1 hypothetical protein IE81DRAFT_364639 [Ceraceosorus guamensis]